MSIGFVRSTELLRSELHASLRDPVLSAMNFLNEVIDRFPEAISFGPGAPYPGFFDGVDIYEHIDRYIRHLEDIYKLTPKQVRRKIFEYGPSHGQIRELVAKFLECDLGMVIPSEGVVITVGCQEAMLLVLRSLRANSRDVLAVVTPSYVGIMGAARLLDFEMVPIEEGSTGINLDQLETTCKAMRAVGKKLRALYVAPDFANPSGSLMGLSTRKALLELAVREDFLVLEDSTYSFTASEDEALPSLKKLDCSCRVVYMGTFSKVCLPGARVGFVVADQAVCGTTSEGRLFADELAALKTMVTVNTSPICQAIIGGMLLAYGGSFTQLAARKAAVYQENMRHLLGSLHWHLGQCKFVQWNAPQGGFFVRMRLPIVVDEALLEFSARNYGVLWTPMAHFYLENLQSYELRLSCSYLTTEQIDEGVIRLAALLKHVCSS